MRTFLLLLGLAACSSSGGTSTDAGPDATDDGGGADVATDGGPAASGWSYAKIGGGGFVTGATVASDGTKFFRTDTSGAYVYDDTTGHFSQVVPRNLPAGTNVAWNGTGCYEAMIAPSNSQILFAAYRNAVYRSADRGATFAATKTDFSFDSNNGNMRTLERHGAVDPQTPDHVLFGDAVAMYRTTDGGKTWSKPTGLPAATSFNGDVAGFSGVAFNPKAALVGGVTSEVIVSTGGKFFRSTDGGATFSDISSGGPTGEPRVAEFDGKGRYVTSLDPKGMWRWQNGWTNLQSPDQGDTTFFIDPQNDDHLVVSSGFKVGLTSTTNGGSTWSPAQFAKVSQTSVDDIPWHATSPHYYPANVMLDAAHATLWMPGGNQGVASFPLASLFGAPPYTAQMHGIGIENMCANVIVAPPGSKKLHVAVWDETYGQLDRDNVSYPSVFNDLEPGNFGPSWGLDVSKEDPKYLARWISTANFAKSGWTDDGGATWNAFATLPEGITDITTQWGYGGTVAYSGKDNIIIVSSNTNNKTGTPRPPYYTLDRGATWKPVTLPTGAWTLANIAQVHFAYYLNREILVADHSTLGRFYFLVMSPDSTIRGVYTTSDGGATWTLAHPDLPTGFWGYNAHIESPVANHLWMGGGDEGHPGPGTAPLYRSTDGGVTFTALPDVVTPAKFAFGAPAHPGGYPVLFMQGFYKGQSGVWMSPDADQPSPTWIAIGDAPNDQWSAPRFMAGDPDVPGRVWVGTGCAGIQFGEFGSLL